MSWLRRWPSCTQKKVQPPLPPLPLAPACPPCALFFLCSYLSWDDYFMAVAFLSAQRSKDPNKQASWVPPGLQSARSWVNDQQLVEHGLGPDSCRPMTRHVKDPPDSNSSGLAGD